MWGDTLTAEAKRPLGVSLKKDSVEGKRQKCGNIPDWGKASEKVLK